MKIEHLLIYGVLGYFTYMLVAKAQAASALPPLPGATLFDTVTGLPVLEPAALQSSIPLLRGEE